MPLVFEIMHCTLPQPLPSKGGGLKSPLPWWERVREREHFSERKKLTRHH